MDAALLASQTIGLRAAAKAFSVSRTTLANRLKGVHERRRGGKQKFSEIQESVLVQLLHNCAQLGVPLQKKLLLKIVAKVAVEKGLPSPTVSEKWFRGFLRRHSDISERISYASDRKKMREWDGNKCDKWLTVLSDWHIGGWLDDPSGIWNTDETAFQLAEGVSRVIVTERMKEVPSYMDGTDRELTTVLACGNAAGVMLTPLILYDGKTHIGSRFDGTNSSCRIATNYSGIMDCAVFCDYMRKEVFPSMTAAKVRTEMCESGQETARGGEDFLERSVCHYLVVVGLQNVIFLDGHSSHVFNVDFLMDCISSVKNIRVVCFPAGQTGKLQPLDRSVFGAVKKRWRDHLREAFTMISEQVNSLYLCEEMVFLSNIRTSLQITQNTFPAYLMDLWLTFNFGNNLPSGFLKQESIRTILPLYGTLPQKSISGPDKGFSFKKTFESQLTGARKHLNEIYMFCESDVDQIIAEVVERGEGKSYEKTVDAVEEFRAAVFGTRPEKRKRFKDTRLSTDAGLTLTEVEYPSALRRRKDLQKKKQKGGSKKRAVSDISNTHREGQNVRAQRFSSS